MENIDLRSMIDWLICWVWIGDGVVISTVAVTEGIGARNSGRCFLFLLSQGGSVVGRQAQFMCVSAVRSLAFFYEGEAFRGSS